MNAAVLLCVFLLLWLPHGSHRHAVAWQNPADSRVVGYPHYNYHLRNVSLPTFPVHPEDIVIVTSTDQERLPLALASRSLRPGIRTFIAINNETLAHELNQQGGNHNETWGYFPDRGEPGPFRSKPGDTRWQSVPFMAHRHYGPTYKWMLLGDDDTLWFMHGLRLLLRHFNHSLPYAISDHLGDHNKRGYFVPSPYAAVCLPCHWEQLLPPPAPRRNASASAGAAADGGNSSDSSAGSSGSSSDSHLHPDAGGAAWNATTSSSSLGAVRHLLEGAVGAAGGGVADAYPAAGGAAGIGDGLAASRAAAGGRDFGDLDDGEQSPGNDGGALGLSPQLNQEALAAAADERKSVALLLRLQQQEKADPRRSLVPLPGCPCSQALACKHRARVCRRRACTDAKGFRGDMKVCRHSWGHGGAGIVLSVGLMQAIAGGPAEACAMAKAVHSCDMNLALCLQQSGFMFTQAGYSIGHGASWSDPRFIVFDNPIHRYALKDPLGVLQGRVECAGEPDPHRHCRWLLAHAVSVHMQARGYAGIADAAGAMRAVARQHRKAMRQLKAEHAAGAVGMPGTGAGAGNGSHGGAGRAGAAEGG